MAEIEQNAPVRFVLTNAKDISNIGSNAIIFKNTSTGQPDGIYVNNKKYSVPSINEDYVNILTNLLVKSYIASENSDASGYYYIFDPDEFSLLKVLQDYQNQEFIYNKLGDYLTYINPTWRIYYETIKNEPEYFEFDTNRVYKGYTLTYNGGGIEPILKNICDYPEKTNITFIMINLNYMFEMENIIEFPYACFYNCTNLKEIYFWTNDNFDINQYGNNSILLFNASCFEGSGLEKFILKKLNINSTTTSFPQIIFNNDCFNACKNLKEFKLDSAALVKFYDRCFYNCNSLETFSCTNNSTYTNFIHFSGGLIFGNCISLKNFIIDNNSAFNIKKTDSFFYGNDFLKINKDIFWKSFVRLNYNEYFLDYSTEYGNSYLIIPDIFNNTNFKWDDVLDFFYYIIYGGDAGYQPLFAHSQSEYVLLNLERTFKNNNFMYINKWERFGKDIFYGYKSLKYTLNRPLRIFEGCYVAYIEFLKRQLTMDGTCLFRGDDTAYLFGSDGGSYSDLIGLTLIKNADSFPAKPEGYVLLS